MAHLSLFNSARHAEFAHMLTRLLVCLTLATGAARADFTIVQKVEGAENAGQMTIRLQGDQVRADIAPQVSTITDLASGDVVTLQHALKVFIRLPAAQARAMLARVNQQQQATAAEPPKPVDTGRREKVERRMCEVFTWSSGEIRAVDWVAKDFPRLDAVVPALERFQNAGLAAVAQSLQPPLSALSGMLIRRELTIRGQKTTTTLLSVSEAPIDVSVFAVPPDYKEQPAPLFQFPSAPTGK